MRVFACVVVATLLATPAIAQSSSGWASPAAAPAEAEAPASTGVAGAGSWGSAPQAETVPGFEPEEQVATGRFLTALEVKPILTATQGNWIAVREYNGQDLLYFTHLLAWRCGLHQIRYSVNGGAVEVFPAEPCYVDTNVPNAIKAEEILPYLVFPLQSVEGVAVHLIFDDATEATARFERKAILMP